MFQVENKHLKGAKFAGITGCRGFQTLFECNVAAPEHPEGACQAPPRAKRAFQPSAAKATQGLWGCELKKTARHGKHLFVKTTGDGWLRLHFGMTGFLRYYKNRDRQPGHVRLRLDFSNGYCLAYDNPRLLGQIGWAPSPSEFVDDQKLGPDALNLDLDQFKQLLSNRRGMIKSTLMNQNAIAGLGNIYSDEILFQAKIHPRTPSEDLAGSELKMLYEAMRTVLRKAIEKKADPQQFPEHFLTPRRDEAEHCPRCGAGVKKIALSGRSGFICPDCQKPPD